MDKDKPVNKVCYDICEIFTRLFDHRPFLNGEVQQFLREFEEKRGDKDIESLLKSREKLIDLQDSLGTFDGTSTRSSLTKLLETIQKTAAAIDTVSTKEEAKQIDTQAKEEQRKKRWQGFLEESTEKLRSVDNYIKEQELELREHYEQLEEKLKQGL